MKKVVLLFLSCLLFLPTLSKAQFSLGNRYFWQDTLHIFAGKPNAVDTTYTSEWEFVNIYADTVDIYIIVGAPDYGSWSSRVPTYLPQGLSLSIGPNPKLKRLKVWTKNGEGVLYLVGYKRERQY